MDHVYGDQVVIRIVGANRHNVLERARVDVVDAELNILDFVLKSVAVVCFESQRYRSAVRIATVTNNLNTGIVVERLTAFDVLRLGFDREFVKPILLSDRHFDGHHPGILEEGRKVVLITALVGPVQNLRHRRGHIVDQVAFGVANIVDVYRIGANAARYGAIGCDFYKVCSIVGVREIQFAAADTGTIVKANDVINATRNKRIFGQ